MFKLKGIPLKNHFSYLMSIPYRRFLENVVFMGVTGSCGKTTTKDLTAAILLKHSKGVKSPGNDNQLVDVARTILRCRPWYRFCIQEIATRTPGMLDRKVSLLKPHFGIVTNVRNDHYKEFRGRENVRAEKAKLIKALPENGLAILNGDDPLVVTMGEETRARIMTYGFSEDAHVKASHAASPWPSRLCFRVSYGGETLQVQTRLLGLHLIGSALASLSAALGMGVPLGEAVRSLEALEPTERRMSVYMSPDEVTFIRDDFKAPWDSMFEILEFLRTARAARKIAIIGTISDYGGSSSKKYRKFAKEALGILDLTAFVGRYSPSYVKKIAASSNGGIVGFHTLKEAKEHLADHFRPGDLVMVKGSSADHLWRIALSREMDVGCWAKRCAFKTRACEACPLLQKHWKPDEVPQM